MYVMADN